MGYVFDFKDATWYDQWFSSREQQLFTRAKRLLIERLLKPVRGETVLDIGCGTGGDLLYFHEKGLDATGVDPSPYMLDRARGLLGHRAELHRGFGEDLPFEDNSFHICSLFFTLEFCEDPASVVAEACRVARRRIVLGCLNRYALEAAEKRIRGVFTANIYNRARFFGVWELKHMIRAAVGDVPLQWATVGNLPVGCMRYTGWMGGSSWTLRSPCGAFIAMVAALTPRFSTRPLEIPYKAKQTGKLVAG